MYQSHYQLDLDPFRLTPDPRFAYPHTAFRDALTSMQRALEQRDGILVITGRPGTGKTTLCEEFLSGCQADKIPTTVVIASQLQQGEFLNMVARALHVDLAGRAAADLLEQIESFLLARPGSVLIVDEAQNLSEVALHEVLALSGLQREAQPLLQVYLVGQENLTENLSSPDQAQLRQSITRVNHLGALDLQQTSAYILHRLGRAGWAGHPSISTEALVLIHRFSLGLPRHICKLSSRLLMYGAVHGLTLLDIRSVACVVAELQEEMLMPQTGAAAFPSVQALQASHCAGLGDLVELTQEEREFLAENPILMTDAPEVIRISEASVPVAPVTVPASVTQPSLVPETAARNGSGWWGSNRQYYRYAAVIVALAFAGYFLATEPSVKPAKSEAGAVPEQSRQLAMPQLEYVSVISERVSLPEPLTPVPAVAPKLGEVSVNLKRVSAAVHSSGELDSDVAPVTAEAVGVITDGAGMVAIALDGKIAELLLLGTDAMAKNYLTTPDELSAYHYYSQVLQLNPDSAAGNSGLQAIARRYEFMAITMMEQGRYNVANVFVQRGLSVVKEYSALLALQLELESQAGSVQEPVDDKGEVAKPAKKGLIGVLKRFPGGSDPAPG